MTAQFDADFDYESDEYTPDEEAGVTPHSTRRDAYQVTRMVRTNTDWMSQAACAGLADVSADAWFPPVGNAKAKARMAKRICEQCPVRLECLSYALHHNIVHGVWGGLTPNERKLLRHNMGETSDDLTA